MLAAVLSSLCVLGVELFWHQLGHRPTVVDTPALWAYHRGRLATGEAHSVALIGTSRMLTGFSLDAFQRRYPAVPIVQLAIPECAPGRILRDLAEDSSFHGIVLCDLTAAAFADQVSEKYSKEEFLDYYHHQRSWNTDLNARLEAALQQKLCCRNPDLGLDRVLNRWLERGTLPEPVPWVTRFDRRQLADYQIPNIRRARALTIGKMRHWFTENITQKPEPAEWLKVAMQIEPAVRKIQSKEGQVAFVRFPSTETTWELEASHFPKSEFWDRFAASTSAVTVHFRDVATLANTECPDTSHIDYRDADRFTEQLLDALVDRGVKFDQPAAAADGRRNANENPASGSSQ